ncbi:2,3-bisphosphoglycerate-dependent phosphoglycerate mutase [Pullulanibacillus pueri]|uniref:Phosphoglycerate mutase n=1 Tax=Pullulanibacillus pueri TaxID=1437324 RepID=A0A8J3EKH3_9BACL|nr:histidine phosphatase family protein [Pullulanibacillus pueri]MBM7681154.1 2,3-bisphosphoglycerate-dependent phosphoglycerate mutase [Pullulanibacillus pueri]GGH77257.1 phosphoglycerate mutase [Pullulanibacillus pueri]
MSTHLYLVRHAHSVYSADEFGRPLSEQGRHDALLVTECLKTEGIDQVISSPYQRAKETVQGIASIIHKEIEIISDLRERQLSRVPVNDFNLAIDKVWQDPNFSFEGGESNHKAQRRGVQVILQLLMKYAGKRIVVGTHGNLMVLIMQHFDERYNYEFWKTLDMPDIYRFSFDGQHLKEVKRLWKRSQRDE